jgi:hypothetical protein
MNTHIAYNCILFVVETSANHNNSDRIGILLYAWGQHHDLNLPIFVYFLREIAFKNNVMILMLQNYAVFWTKRRFFAFVLAKKILKRNIGPWTLTPVALAPNLPWRILYWIWNPSVFVSEILKHNFIWLLVF